MGVAENIELVRRFYAAGPADDDAKRSEFAVPDVVWHVPGDNRVAGRYQGYAEVFGTIGARMQPLDEWTIDVRDVMGNGGMVVGVVDLVAVRGSTGWNARPPTRSASHPTAGSPRRWGFLGDQAGLDALFSS